MKLNPTHNVFVSHERKILLFWSQKAACGSAAKWFAKAVLNVKKNREQLRASEYCMRFKSAMPYVDNGYKTIFVCRNPYYRSVSAYINKFYINPRKGLFDTFESLHPHSRELYRETRNPEPYTGWSFDEFLRAIRLAMFKRKVINGHWDTQIPRNCSIRFKPDFLVRVESFDSDLQNVITSLDLPQYTPEPDNRTVYDKSFRESTELLDKVSSLDLLSQRIALKPHNLLSDDSMKLICQMYAEDFSYFGYAL